MISFWTPVQTRLNVPEMVIGEPVMLSAPQVAPPFAVSAAEVTVPAPPVPEQAIVATPETLVTLQPEVKFRAMKLVRVSTWAPLFWIWMMDCCAEAGSAHSRQRTASRSRERFKVMVGLNCTAGVAGGWRFQGMGFPGVSGLALRLSYRGKRRTGGGWPHVMRFNGLLPTIPLCGTKGFSQPSQDCQPAEPIKPCHHAGIG